MAPLQVSRIKIQQFRNLSEIELRPDSGLTFLVGPNGSGKTSCLEALNVAATLRSFREGKPEDWIQRGTSQAKILLESTEEDRCYEVHLKRSENDRIQKTALINGKIFPRATEYLKQRLGPTQSGLHAVVFSPSQIEIATGEPSLRRDYLQAVTTAEEPTHLDTYKRYFRALEQRNAMLKDSRLGAWHGSDPFADELYATGAHIVFERLLWLQKLAIKLPEVLREIVETELEVIVGYKSNFLVKTNSYRDCELIEINGLWPVPPLEIIHDTFLRSSAQALSAERVVGSTLVGPHRDDWGFFIRGRELKRVASQGEIRAVILSLKLAELMLFQDKTRFAPMLLVDDFSSELDARRRTRLLEHLVNARVQTLVTATEAPGADYSTVRLAQGRVA